MNLVSLWPLLIAASTFAGCLSGAEIGKSALDRPLETPAGADPWGGTDRQGLLEIHADMLYQFDVLCVAGGGPILERNGEGRVLAGASHVIANVRVDPTFSGFQLGYVLDEDPAYDETAQEGIAWLPPVRGGEATFEIPVPEDGFEPADGPILWAFYHRDVPVIPAVDCYTGGGTGKWDVVIEAVKLAEPLE